MVSPASTRIANAALFCLIVTVSAAASPPFQPASAERGKALAATCVACHGAPEATADDPPIHPPKLAGQRPEAIFLALIEYKRGARKSAVMGPLVAAIPMQDLRDLGAYLSAEGPVKPPTVAGEGSWAHEKVHRDCTACHGETGMGEMWGIPVLTGQNVDYLLHALNAYRSGARKNAVMGPIAAGLTPREIEQLAEYFSMQTYLRNIP